MKRSLFFSFLSCLFLPIHAGDYLTNTNQHVNFLRNPARNATTEIDALYSNPAGISHLKEGWHFSFNGQSAFQTRNIKTTFAPFSKNETYKDENSRNYKGVASAPFIPSFFMAFKQGNWTFGGHFALSGGGGKAIFNTGLPSFEAGVAKMFYGLNARLKNNPALQSTNYKFDTYMEGQQYIFGLNFGGAYQINPSVSVYLGGRFNYVANHYEGYLKNIAFNFNSLGGTFAPVSSFIGNLLQQVPILEQMGKQQEAQQLKALEPLVELGKDKVLNVSQTGWGFTPVIGIDYKWEQLNIGFKFELPTKLNIQNQTKENTTGIAEFNNGVNTPQDIPGMLALGASYQVCKPVNISLGYNYYLDKVAKMTDNRQKSLKHNTQEFLLGMEYNVTKQLSLSIGGQVTDYGLSDEFQRDLSFYCDSYSIGLGGSFKITENLKFNLGYLITKYQNYQKEITNYHNTNLPATEVFSRTNQVLGAGIDIYF